MGRAVGITTVFMSACASHAADLRDSPRGGKLRGRRAETDDVAIRVDEDSFVLPPFGVLRSVHRAAPRCPRGCHAVGIVDEQVGSDGPAIAVRFDAEVDLDPVPGGEAVATTVVRPNREAKALAEVHRHPKITH